MSARVLACLLGLAAGGCLWHDVVVETWPIETSRPPSVEPGKGDPAEDAPADGAGHGGAAQGAGQGAGMEVAAAVREWRPPMVELAGPHGLLVVTPRLVPAEPGAPGIVRLTLPVGSRAGRAGLAELAAEVVAELRVPTRAGGSLRGALQRIGAHLDVVVTASCTAFEVTFPPDRWREVLALLGGSLAQPLDPTASEDAFEAVRLALARRLGREWAEQPLLAMVERLRGHRTHALAEVLGQIGLRTAAEVASFQRTRYRAAGAVLALWVPGVHAGELGLGVLAELPPWLDVNEAAMSLPVVAAPSAEGGVFWAPHDGPVELAVLLPEPGLDEPLAAELLVLQECLTLEGVGGRLGAAIAQFAGRDVGFSVLPASDTGQCGLVARVSEELALPLWLAAAEVLDSFRTRPPEEAEVRAAAARAKMRLLARLASPREWLRIVTRLAYKRAAPDRIDATLERLDFPGRLDLDAALAAFAKEPVTLAVVGGRPPVESSRLVQLVPDGVLRPERVERILPPAELEAARAEADKLLAKVADAAGGIEVLRALRGFRERATCESGVGPTVEVETALELGGELRQTRRVLGTTIEARLDESGGTEAAGQQRHGVTVDEARARLADAARHPLVVLARWSRGELAFRHLALRMAGDREHAVLEEVTPRRDGLRIAIDTGSFLIRVIEARTWNPDTGALAVRDELLDYRTVQGGLRAPFLRVRTMAEGTPAVRTRVGAFEPTLRPR